MPTRKPLATISGYIKEISVGEELAVSPKWSMVADTIDIGEEVIVPEHRQLIIASSLTNNGTLNNSGMVYIL